jgi:hypothetical protein
MVGVLSTLYKNRDKSFVKRIINPNAYPVLKNPDCSVSTHSMSWAERDGKYYVFPTFLRSVSGDLKRYSNEEAWRHTQATGNFIVFDDPDEADFFSKHYKDIW